MLSYCWHPDARPDAVIAVEKELRKRGCDVWRDEVGSSLLPPMHGSTHDCMAKAVEFSSLVVVFVSKQYKESPNCRCECKYANQLRGRNKLDIVFVMMQKEYTTCSDPNYCDGWLGFMIGDSFWLPLYDEECVEDTSTEIMKRLYAAEELHKTSFKETSTSIIDVPIVANQASSSIDSGTYQIENITSGSSVQVPKTYDLIARTEDDYTPKVEISHRSPKQLDFSAADETFVLGAPIQERACSFDDVFQLIRIPENAIHSEEMSNLIFVLGITSIEDLWALQRDDILLLARYLKRGPRFRFLSLINTN